MNTPSSQVMHQSNGNLKYNITPVVPFVMCLSGLWWALQLNLSMRTVGKKQCSPAGRLADICKAIPQHNYLWTSGPCQHRAIFFSCLHQLSSSSFIGCPLLFSTSFRCSCLHSFILLPLCHLACKSVYALSLEFHDFINSPSAYLQHCSHCFPPTVCGHLCVLKLPPSFFPSVLPLLNSFTVVILTPVKTSPPPQAYLPFK